MNIISVLLVDNSPDFVRAAAQFLREAEGVILVGTACLGPDGLEKAQMLWPDVALLDLGVPGLSGLEMIPRFRRAVPTTGIIATSLLDIEAYRTAARSVGADQFVCKASLSTDLMPAIRKVAVHYRYQGEWTMHGSSRFSDS